MVSPSSVNACACDLQALQTLQGQFRGSSYGEPTEDEARWFLRDRDFDVVEAYEKLSATLRWRSESNIKAVTYQRVAREDASGKAYLHASTDIYNRPVLVIRVERYAARPFVL